MKFFIKFMCWIGLGKGILALSFQLSWNMTCIGGDFATFWNPIGSFNSDNQQSDLIKTFAS